MNEINDDDDDLYNFYMIDSQFLKF